MYTAASNDIKNAATNLKQEARGAASEVRDELRDAAGKAGRKVRGFIDHAGDEISHTTEIVTSQIRGNPVQSSLIALGAGFILGALFRR